MPDPAISNGLCVELVSPGLVRDAGQAFELKFLLTLAEAAKIEEWARTHMVPDPHGDGGLYRITSVYCDTPSFDVLHRSPGFRRSKFRLRRYGSEERVYLERKSKRKDRVEKRRSDVCEEELQLLAVEPTPLEWHAAWFHKKISRRGLRPACRITYWRRAFFKQLGEHPVRLTLDHGLIGAAAADWNQSPVHDGEPLLPDHKLLELKFHVQMPSLFHDLLQHLPAQPARVSKYRLCMERCGLGPTNAVLPLPEIPLKQGA
ncbi:MAG TPA: polyphosphate polymerase domain-containing protein [Gemmataceae bacterium]|nr:polyphosphate polymerase domain-containing protein [Gemmataceae bacterium]